MRSTVSQLQLDSHRARRTRSPSSCQARWLVVGQSLIGDHRWPPSGATRWRQRKWSRNQSATADRLISRWWPSSLGRPRTAAKSQSIKTPPADRRPICHRPQLAPSIMSRGAQSRRIGEPQVEQTATCRFLPAHSCADRWPHFRRQLAPPSSSSSDATANWIPTWS